MLTPELRAQIKHLQIYTKRVVTNSLSGDYLSAFKGSGLEFDQIREYQMGDDIRYIDWNSSAKMNKTMVKQFIEERDRTVIIAVDTSGSTQCSSQKDLRINTITQVAATLAFIAHENKDKIGLLLFSDKVEQWIPPKKGSVQISRTIETLFSAQAQQKTTTNIAEMLKFMINQKKRNAVLFVVSDWIDATKDYQKLLRIAGAEYDFIGVRLLDDREQSFPDIGFLEVEDPETGSVGFLDTRKHKNLNTLLKARALEQKKTLEKCKIDMLDLHVGKPFVNNLVRFFHQHIRRSI